MGFPMTYARVIERNNLTGDYADDDRELSREEQQRRMIAGDLRRLERDNLTDRQIVRCEEETGVSAADVSKVLQWFLDRW